MTAVAARMYSATPPIAILGVPFDNVTAVEMSDLIERMVASRQPHYLTTANIDFLVQAQKEADLRRILFDANLVLCDGILLGWASRLLGSPLPERITGPDLAPFLIREAAKKGYRLFFLASSQDSAERAMKNLKARHPGLNIAGCYSPSAPGASQMDDAEIKQQIVEARPDLLLVSFGFPGQEKWIASHYRSLDVPVSIGVGAAIEYADGSVKRGPGWNAGRFFKFYARDLWVFCWKIFIQWWQLQFRSCNADRRQISAPVRAEENWQWIKLPERLDLATVRDDALLVEQVLADGRHCLLEMDGVKFIDSTGMGLLIRLQKKVRATGRQLLLLAPSIMAQRALAVMHLQNFFVAVPDFASAQQWIEARSNEPAAAVGAATALKPLLWQGEVTAANANQVWEATHAYLTAAPQNSELAIDLSGVRFVDSTGVGIMVRAKKLAQHNDTPLFFSGLQPAVRNVLRVSQLEEFLLAENTE